MPAAERSRYAAGMTRTRLLRSGVLFCHSLLLGGLLLAAGCTRGAEPPSGGAPPRPAATAATAATATPTAAAPAGHVDAAGAEALLASNQDAKVIDVRTPAEFQTGHIPGATNVDFVADNFATELAKLDRKKTYIVHCAAGGRSTQSLAVFARLGFTSVQHLDGGLNGWIAAGKPVAK